MKYSAIPHMEYSRKYQVEKLTVQKIKICCKSVKLTSECFWSLYFLPFFPLQKIIWGIAEMLEISS